MEKTTTPPKSARKILKVSDTLAYTALNWPGHFGGMLSLNKKKVKSKDPTKPLEMFMDNAWPGWLFVKHDGALAATNGNIFCTLETEKTEE